MSDNLDMTPQLTLTPEADTAAAAAPAAPEAPTLTLEPAAADPADEAAAQKERDAHAVKLDESQLTEAERKMVNETSPTPAWCSSTAPPPRRTSPASRKTH